MFDTETFIGAENSNNFFTLKKNSEAILQEDRQRLELTGEYHFGEFVNRFRAGSLVMKSLEGEGLNISTLICCSVSGVIGLVGQITEEQYNFLIQVQGELNKVFFFFNLSRIFIYLEQKKFFFHHFLFSRLSKEWEDSVIKNGDHLLMTEEVQSLLVGSLMEI